MTTSTLWIPGFLVLVLIAGAGAAEEPSELPTAAMENVEATLTEQESVADDAAVDAPAVPEIVPMGNPDLPGVVGYDSQGRPGRIHLVIGGDTLWDISNAYLGTPWVWPSIWQDNRNIENPHLIYPGNRIWITPNEMRVISDEEAEAFMAGQPAPPPEPPAAPTEVVEVPPEIPLALPPATLSLELSSWEAVGLISPEELESSASIVDAITERLMLSQNDRVYIGLGSGAVEVGDQFTVFRTREKVYDPDTRRLLGYHVDLLGWAEVDEVYPETSLALLRQSTSEIERGDRLMPREPVPAEIPLGSSPQGVTGKVSFFAQSRTVMGMIDYVYLNRGTLDGVEVGSPLEIYRPGFVAREAARNEAVHVPDRVVAQLVVVRSQPGSSVAFVTHTAEELHVGDTFRGATE